MILIRKIHIIDFDDENNIINKNVLLHQVGEIWHISASPADKGVLATCYNKTIRWNGGTQLPYSMCESYFWCLCVHLGQEWSAEGIGGLS
ncbi:UNVERIFIED_CONTAM: hypothetical protein K2H54_024623 [Gekko kuhli]